MRARVSEAFSAPRANMASEALRSSESRRSRASIACPCSVRIRYALRTRLRGSDRGMPSFSSLQALKNAHSAHYLKPPELSLPGRSRPPRDEIQGKYQGKYQAREYQGNTRGNTEDRETWGISQTS